MKNSGNKKQLLTQIIGLCANIILGIAKLYLGLVSNSITILSDGYNNIGDGLGSGLGIAGFSLSKKQPTEKHPHGFGRIEDIVSLVFYLVFVVFGAYFVYNSVERLFYHPPIIFTWWTLVVMICTIPVKLLMALMYRLVNKKNSSNILKANVFDSILDGVMTTIVVVSYGLSALNLPSVDSIFGIVIGGVLVGSGIRQMISIAGDLIGKDIQQETKQKLEEFGLQPTKFSAHAYGRRIEVIATFQQDVDEQTIQKLEEQNIFLTII